MVDADALRRLALALPEAVDESEGDRPCFTVGGKGFAWPYLKRPAPKAPRQPQPGMIAVRCGLERKEMLIEALPAAFFDDDHFRGYRAVLVRLAQVDEDELAGVLLEAWRMCAPKRLLQGAGR